MAKAIEVYLKNTFVPVGVEEVFVLMCPGHECTRNPATFAKLERILAEPDRKALEIVTTIADEKRLNVRVYNVSTLKGKIRARLKGVQTTPTIIIDSHRVEDEITREKLLSAL